MYANCILTVPLLYPQYTPTVTLLYPHCTPIVPSLYPICIYLYPHAVVIEVFSVTLLASVGNVFDFFLIWMMNFI